VVIGWLFAALTVAGWQEERFPFTLRPCDPSPNTPTDEILQLEARALGMTLVCIVGLLYRDVNVLRSLPGIIRVS
jgi:hypothetical protein